MIHKNCRWTHSKARLCCIKKGDFALHWIFLGKIGFGSESLSPLLRLLKQYLPGNFWQLDLPFDGSNHQGSFVDWNLALLEALSEFEKGVLIAYSTGADFALSIPTVKEKLKGLIVIQDEGFGSLDPSNDHSLQESVLNSSPSLFNPKMKQQGEEFLKKLSYNGAAFRWFENHKNAPQTHPDLFLKEQKPFAWMEYPEKYLSLFQNFAVKLTLTNSL